MVEFTDKVSIETWLEGRPQRVAIALAYRATLRVAPAYLQFQDQKAESGWATTLRLAGLRATLTSGVAATCPTPDVTDELKAAALSDSAALSADSAALSADSAALSAASAALSAASARSAALSAVRSARSAASALSADSAALSALSADSAALSAARSADSAALSAARSAISIDAGGLRSTSEETALRDITTLYGRPGWPDAIPATIDQNLKDFIATAHTPGGPWAFWADWFQGAWDGTPRFPRDLLEQIVLIPDEHWKGKDAPVVIAQKIDAILDEFGWKADAQENPFNSEETAKFDPNVARRIVKFTQVARGIQRNTTNNTFGFEASGPNAPSVAEYARLNVVEALKHALQMAGPNGINENCEDVQLLRRVHSEYPDHPSHLAVTYLNARQGLSEKIGSEYPDTNALRTLIVRLRASQEELCDDDEAARKRCARYEALPDPAPLPPDIAQQLKSAPAEFSNELDRDVQQAMEAETSQVIDTPHPNKLSFAKLTNWWTSIGIYIDNAKKEHGRYKWVFQLIVSIWKFWMP